MRQFGICACGWMLVMSVGCTGVLRSSSSLSCGLVPCSDYGRASVQCGDASSSCATNETGCTGCTGCGGCCRSASSGGGWGLLGPTFSDPRLTEGTAPCLWQYGYNVILSGSQMCNAILGGDPDESLSSRFGRAEQDGCWPVKHVIAPATDLLIGPDHCLKSTECQGNRKREVWSW